MHKIILVLILGSLLYTTASAQNGGLIYYLKNDGKLVSTKGHADYSIMVLPPDTSVDKNLYTVREYDKNGKLRLLTGSYTSDVNLQYQGRYIAYFPNGKKKRIGIYKGGEPVGKEIDYYPNGKLYSTKTFIRSLAYYEECRDSIGTVLAEKGNGTWVQYDEDFKFELAKGMITNGVEVGIWHLRKTAKESFDLDYKKGRVIATAIQDSDREDNFKPIDVAPEFPGGMEAFMKFLNHNTHYPSQARENGTQGNVQVSFVVERDGILTNIKVTRGIGDGCDEEAIRVVKLMPKWKPGIQNGNAVRVAYTIPVRFTSSN